MIRRCSTCMQVDCEPLLNIRIILLTTLLLQKKKKLKHFWQFRAVLPTLVPADSKSARQSPLISPSTTKFRKWPGPVIWQHGSWLITYARTKLLVVELAISRKWTWMVGGLFWVLSFSLYLNKSKRPFRFRFGSNFPTKEASVGGGFPNENRQTFTLVREAESFRPPFLFPRNFPAKSYDAELWNCLRLIKQFIIQTKF